MGIQVIFFVGDLFCRKFYEDKSKKMLKNSTLDVEIFYTHDHSH